MAKKKKVNKKLSEAQKRRILAKRKRIAEAKKAQYFISELKDIRSESEDILKKIKKHAITPQDAEGVLKDVVVRLGGVVGDLSDMSQFAASDKEDSLVK